MEVARSSDRAESSVALGTPTVRSLRSRPHQREQDHVADARLVQQEHAEPVDADAQAAGRGHRVLQGADEVVVHLGHRVLVLLAGELLAEQLLLQDRVVQLGVGVGQLHPVDEQLEPLGDRRVRRLPLGQRADRGRVVDDEDGPVEAVLDDLLEDLADDDVGVLARGRDARAPRPSARTAVVVGRVDARRARGTARRRSGAARGA